MSYINLHFHQCFPRNILEIRIYFVDSTAYVDMLTSKYTCMKLIRAHTQNERRGKVRQRFRNREQRSTVASEDFHSSVVLHTIPQYILPYRKVKRSFHVCYSEKHQPVLPRESCKTGKPNFVDSVYISGQNRRSFLEEMKTSEEVPNENKCISFLILPRDLYIVIE